MIEDPVEQARLAWIQAEIDGYYGWMAKHPEDGAIPFESREQATRLLSDVTPHGRPIEHYSRRFNGLSLVGTVLWKSHGPALQAVDYAAFTLDKHDRLCLVVVTRKYPPNTKALPGGHPDSIVRQNALGRPHESSVDGAVRELLEETALRIPTDVHEDRVPGVDVPGELTRRYIDGVVRELRDTIVFGSFVPRPADGELKLHPDDDVVAVELYPVADLLDDINSGRIELLSDHGVLITLGTNTFKQRLESAVARNPQRLADAQLRFALDQLRELMPVLTPMVAAADQSRHLALYTA